ncbi:MAG TPA: nuclear transport factor 2 family protein [Rhizomicrobium sp.]|nr:nuclear transport factor 2 family protein [Rhizomicrobium sp.]
MDSEKDILSLAKRFFDGIEQGNVNILREVYSPDVGIWHNTDDLVQTVDDNVTTLTGFISRISDRRYENRRTYAFPGGFVQQHRLTGVRKDGEKVQLDACLVCLVKDGRITRLDEYFDSAAVANFRKGA